MKRAARATGDGIPSIGNLALRDRKTTLGLAYRKERHEEEPGPSAEPSFLLTQTPLRNRWKTVRDSEAGESQSSSSILHLFRALLREASYLPDPASRAFVHTQITNRFHRNRNSSPGGINVDELDSNMSEATRKSMNKQIRHTTSLLAEGRSELQFLKRANSGASTPLAKVLEQTYGRRGKRKHDLLRDLGPQHESPVNSNELRQLAEALDAPSNSGNNDGSNDRTKGGALKRLPLFSDKFVALVKSQMRQKQDHFTKPLPKSAEPKIPDTNTWGRTMPVVRIKNLTIQWYAQTLDRLMPPLPEAEWKRLGELAVGKIKWAGPPKRRATRTCSLETQAQVYEGKGWWGPKTYAQQARDELTRAREAHEMTPRYMRRMWASVFAQCPLMKWDAEKARWNVKWGKVDEEKGVVLSVDRPDFDLSPFEGVDENGRRLGRVLKKE